MFLVDHCSIVNRAVFAACVFLQHHLVLKTLRTKDSQGRAHGPLKSAAFHGDTGIVSIGTWTAERWVTAALRVHAVCDIGLTAKAAKFTTSSPAYRYCRQD